MSKSELITAIHAATARAVAARDAAWAHTSGEIAARDAMQAAADRAAYRAVKNLPARWRRAVRLTIVSSTVGPYWPVFESGPDGQDVKKPFYARLMRVVDEVNS